MNTIDILFKKSDNSFDYIGNDESFDEIYNKIEDPWNQSNLSDEYYFNSRQKLNVIIENIIKNIDHNNIKILEIGCGNGFSTNCIMEKINKSNILISGCDISNIAINKAKENYRNINFFTHNIRDKFNNKEKYDIVIISNLLWYILDDLKICFDNCFDILKCNGSLIFLNAFLKEQKYGTDIIDGFDGMKKFININFNNKKITQELNVSDDFKNDNRYFGLLVIQ